MRQHWRGELKAYIDTSDVKRLEEAAGNLRDRLLIRVLSRLGCRISEALALKTEDINFTQGTITIIHLKIRLKLSCVQCGERLGRGHTFCPMCGAKIEATQAEEQKRHRQRILPIDRHTLAMLQEYVNRGGPLIKNGKKLIFGISRHRGWQIVRECAEKAGLPKLINPETGKLHNVSPHRLRDAFAVNAVKRNDSGDGLRLLQEHLGHQSFNTTARYRKVSGEESRNWYDKLWGGDSDDATS